MNPQDVARQLELLKKELGPSTVRITSEPLGPTLWLSVQVVMAAQDKESQVRDRILDTLIDTIPWYDHGVSAVTTTFSRGRGRKRRDGSDPQMTAEVKVSLREAPPPPAPVCHICGGQH